MLSPSEKNWLESGQHLSEIHADRGFEPGKLRELHFGVLIALRCVDCADGAHAWARLITSNRADFELIRDYRDFKLEVW